MRWPVLVAIIGFAGGVVGEAAPQYLPNTPTWVWGFVFWSAIATIIGATIWGVVGWIRDKSQKAPIPKWMPMWRLRFEKQDTVPFRRLIPLEEAARIAYDQIRVPSQKLNSMVLAVLRRIDGNEQENALSYVCQMLFNNPTIPLYGVHPPSTTFEEIDEFMFSDNASELCEQYGGSNRYHCLAIRNQTSNKD